MVENEEEEETIPSHVAVDTMFLCNRVTQVCEAQATLDPIGWFVFPNTDIALDIVSEALLWTKKKKLVL